MSEELKTLRERIAQQVCNLSENKSECNLCKGGKGCPDQWDDVAGRVDNIIKIFEEASRIVLSLSKVGEMLEFNEGKKCPKCGHDYIVTYYHDSVSALVDCYQTCQQENCEGEHLDRTCQRCHYRWIEKCLSNGS